MQWWYYGGYGVDSAGGEYSLFFHMDRVNIPDVGQTSSGYYFALGVPSASRGGEGDLFLYSAAVGLGMATTEEDTATAAMYVPPVNDSSFRLWHGPIAEGIGKGFSYTYDSAASDGAVGAAGAVYNLHGSGVVNTSNLQPSNDLFYEVNLVLKDRRGLVLSGTNYGDVSLAMGPRGSWEFGFPLLDIISGSIKYGSTEVNLVGGILWNDLQTVQAAPDYPLIPEGGIYLGTWSALQLDNGVAIQAWNLWEKQDAPGQQWISGTNVGRKPKAVAGTAFFPVEENQGTPTRNGGVPLWSTDDFDLNILHPEDPARSPHVTSPDSNITYATAWQLTLNVGKLGRYGVGVPPIIWIFPILTGAPEMHMLGQGKPTYFYEVSAVAYSDPDRKHRIGRAFMEQMGFN